MSLLLVNLFKEGFECTMEMGRQPWSPQATRKARGLWYLTGCHSVCAPKCGDLSATKSPQFPLAVDVNDSIDHLGHLGTRIASITLQCCEIVALAKRHWPCFVVANCSDRGFMSGVMARSPFHDYECVHRTLCHHNVQQLEHDGAST
jgi:hypothetical protein